MRVALLLIGLFIASYSISMGQDSRVYVGLGASLGRSFSTILGSQVDDALDPSKNPRAYVEDLNVTYFGFDVKIEWNNLLIKSGYQFTQRGGEVIGSRFIVDDKIHMRLNAVPLLLGVQPFARGKMKLVNGNIFGGIVYQWDRGSTDLGLWNGGPRNFPVLSVAYGVAVELKTSRSLVLNFQYQKIRDVTDYYTVDIRGHGKFEARTEGSMITGGLLLTLNPGNKKQIDNL
ncbi:MAG: hypothetical protein MJA30_17325 [Cytophagales bacterium]|nr:hypothetical protein [Cytophagales bacterium]